ncbi:hypothetical protein SGLAM104S_06421 [Streptomyces glaucescens]
MREVRRYGDQGQADPGRGELGAVDDLAAAEADDRVVVAGLYVAGQPDGVVEGAAADLVPGGAGQLRGDPLAQLRAGAAADRDGEPAGVRDALVGEDTGQVVEGARPDVDDQRRGDQPGQYRHAISRPRARSSWLSISTQSTSPIGATSIRKPRSTSSW